MSTQPTEGQIKFFNRFLDTLFGRKPIGGGGCYHRYRRLRDLCVFIFKGPGFERSVAEILYDWGAHQGVTEAKAKEYVNYLLAMEIGDPPEPVFEITWYGEYGDLENAVITFNYKLLPGLSPQQKGETDQK
jgi:hypothetical protein